MREQVLAAVIRRDEAVPLRVVEPLHGACRHCRIPCVGLSTPVASPGPCLKLTSPPPFAQWRYRQPESKHKAASTRLPRTRQDPPGAALHTPNTLIRIAISGWRNARRLTIARS